MEASWRWIAVTAIAPIAWGSNYFVTREFLPDGTPLWGAVLRALPAGLILLALARERPRGSWWWKSAVLGTLNVGAFFVLVYIASQLLPTSVASTIMAGSAAVLMALAWPLLRERPAILPAAGALIGVAGVCVMLVGGGAGGGAIGGAIGGAGGAGGAHGVDLHGVDVLGAAASFGAMLMSSLGYILTKRWGAGVRTLSLTSWQLLAGGLVVLPCAVLVEGAPPVVTIPALLGFAYVTLVATALAFVAWFTGLRHLPARSVGLVGLLNPVTGVLLGTLVADERFGVAQAAGTALVIGGVLIGQLRARPKRSPVSAPTAPIASSNSSLTSEPGCSAQRS